MKPSEKWPSTNHYHSFNLSSFLYIFFGLSIGLAIWRASSWFSGLFAFYLVLLQWRLRGLRFAVVPGAAIGAILAWITLGIGVSPEGLISRTLFFSAFGAAANAAIKGAVPEAVSFIGLIAIIALASIAFHALSSVG